MAAGKLGRLPNDPKKARLKLSPFLTADLAPRAINWDLRVGYWPMYGNDRYGDCVFAMIGHAIQVFTANAGTEVRVTDADVLKGYADVTGFREDDPDTDQGTVMQDALDYWRKEGIGSHQIRAFASVDHRSENEMQQAAAIFGVVLLGFYFPGSAWGQFDRGTPWDVVDDDGGNQGGHAVLGARYDQGQEQWYWITWGREHPVTFDFISKYTEEAWVVASDEWVNTTGAAPSGLDVDGLNEAFTELTGDPAPFVKPVPPVVPPLPGALGEAVQSLLSDPEVAAWAGKRHNRPASIVAQKLRALRAAVEPNGV